MNRRHFLLSLFAGLLLVTSGCGVMFENKYEPVYEYGKFNRKDPSTFVSIVPVGWAQVIQVNGNRVRIGGDIIGRCNRIRKKHLDHNYIEGPPGRYHLLVQGFVTRTHAKEYMVCNPYYQLDYEYSAIKHEVSLEFNATAGNGVKRIERGEKPTHKTGSHEQVYYVYYLMKVVASGSRYYAAVTRKGSDRIIASSDRRLIGLSVKDPRFVSRLPKEMMHH